MDWKEETVKNPIKVLQKNYIEGELMNYYYHLHLRDKYAEMAEELEMTYADELDSPRTGGSIVKRPENNQVRSPWQIDLGNRIDCLNLKRELEEQHLNQVDVWLKGIKLSSDQLKMLKEYVMINLENDAAKVAEDTGYTVDNIWKVKERTINKIYFEFFRKKCTVTDT